MDVEGGGGGGEEGVQVEGYAACACAEVEDAEGALKGGGRGGGGEEGGEMGGYVFCFWSVVYYRHLISHWLHEIR